MSFFQMLQQMYHGGQPQPQQPAPQPSPQPPPAPSQNPYGATDEDMKMARWGMLSSVGTQLMALSQQMTPQQRAAMLARADFSGGVGQNIQNAVQMRREQRAADRADRQATREELQFTREEDARKAIGEQIKALPPGKLKQAATYFFVAGDLGKAGELLWTKTQRFDPMTGQMIEVDALGNPIGGGPDLVNGGPLTAPGGGSTPTAPSPSAASAVAPGGGSTSALPAVPDGGQVDQLTTNWRALLRDPALTPQEARIIASQGSQKGAMDAYQKIVSDRQTAAQSAASADQTKLQGNRTAAEALTKDFDAGTKSYDTIISAGQRAAQVATSPQMSPSAKLSTLYQFMKALDPDGAVREGDVEMAQSIQGFLERYGQWAENALAGGGNISDAVVLDMAREMARLANDAQGRKELKRIQLIRRAQGRQVPAEMVTEIDGPGASQNMRAPIGQGIPDAPRNYRDDPVDLHPDDESFISGWQ
jgi:hypothetical protein